MKFSGPRPLQSMEVLAVTSDYHRGNGSTENCCSLIGQLSRSTVEPALLD